MSIDRKANPIHLFKEWHADAHEAKLPEPDACALATSGKDAFPTVRMVLLKDVSERGFVFYTNLGSEKARHLVENPHAALCFYWNGLNRQVRVRGGVEAVSAAEADAYFASRDYLSRIGAWVSRQSEELPGRFALEKRTARFTAQLGKNPGRPDFWSGFRVVPIRIEFWKAGSFRLHERVAFNFKDGAWSSCLLYP